MTLTHRSSIFTKEALTFQILLANGTAETLAVVIVVHSLHPTITSFDRKTTTEAFCCKQLIPIIFAVWKAVLQKEVIVSKLTTAISASETFRMKFLSNSIQAIALDAFLTAGAIRRKIILEATLAIQFTLLLDESDIVQRSAALRLATNKVIRAPRQTQSGDKLSPDLGSA